MPPKAEIPRLKASEFAVKKTPFERLGLPEEQEKIMDQESICRIRKSKEWKNMVALSNNSELHKALKMFFKVISRSPHIFFEVIEKKGLLKKKEVVVIKNRLATFEECFSIKENFGQRTIELKLILSDKVLPDLYREKPLTISIFYADQTIEKVESSCCNPQHDTTQSIEPGIHFKVRRFAFNEIFPDLEALLDHLASEIIKSQK